MKAIHSFFLSGYDNASYFERKKAMYLYYIILSALAFITFVLIGQAYFNTGAIYLIGNLVALNGVVCSLILFKNRKTEAAGHLMAASAICMIVLHNIVRDWFDVDPAMRFRIYINMSSILGVFFLIVCFFREKKIIYYYSLGFVTILLTHALVIDHQIGHLPLMRRYIWEHFSTVLMGIIAVSAIATWLLAYVNALLEQNTEYARLIKVQNEQLEGMVAERTKALTRSNDSLREFAYIVSHDLKEPLRTIAGFVSLMAKELERKGLLEDEVEEYVGYAKSGTRQMEKLISDILAYSKLNVEEKRTDNVNIDEVIGEVKPLLAKALYESDPTLHFTELVNIRGEKRLMVQLFQNLISNAIKYRSADREPEVTIGCVEHSDTLVCYFVKDNGIGIAKQYYDTVFQAFKRLHSKVEYEGTGVGLAICKKIVEIHGGDIWIESVEGEGSTFYFTLPKAYRDVAAMYPVVHAH
jgi:signal transduction histidine kinase